MTLNPTPAAFVWESELRYSAGASLGFSNETPSREALNPLADWARRNGYIFIRFTHSDPRVLSELGAVMRCEDFDAFPYFLDYPVQSPDYIVQQYESEDETLASFDREVRRKLRRAAEMGYELRSDESPEALKKAWSLYQDCAQRKQFRLERPLSVYMETMRLAGVHNCARLYSVHLSGELVGSALAIQNSIGFAITVVSISAATTLFEKVGLDSAWLLVIGPIAGLMGLAPVLWRQARGETSKA